ncbi:MAG: GntR family transcriptional regulator, partial [Acetobacteraceae bacterium]
MNAPAPGPQWRRIASILRAEIAAGQPAPSARLPAEAALAVRFAVNRHTVRQALGALAAEGLIEIRRGAGSFVAEDVLDYEIGRRARFSEWVRRHNREPSGQVLRRELVAAEAAVARALGLAEGAPVLLLERLGLADGRPVSLTAHHFPPLPGLAAALGAAEGISAALAAVGV